MTRSEVVKYIMSEVGMDDIVIASTGYISREVFHVKDRALNFYMMGSMGNALAIGIGMAMNLRNKVIVINGDGSVLMSLGTMVTRGSIHLPNLIHHIIDNGCHESTGGQPTNSHRIYYPNFGEYNIVHKVHKDTSIPPRIKLSPKQITKRFRDAVFAFGYK